MALTGNEFAGQRGSQGLLLNWLWSRIFPAVNSILPNITANFYTKNEVELKLTEAKNNFEFLLSKVDDSSVYVGTLNGLSHEKLNSHAYKIAENPKSLSFFLAHLQGVLFYKVNFQTLNFTDLENWDQVVFENKQEYDYLIDYQSSTVIFNPLLYTENEVESIQIFYQLSKN